LIAYHRFFIKAGIDPLSAEPFKLAMSRMNTVMDQIEELLARKK
jgi:hypothetical protein